MARGRRIPQYLTFKGWLADGTDIVVTARLCVQTTTSVYVETGPLLALRIPAVRFLEDDITDAVNSAHERRVEAERMQAAERAAKAQGTLF